MKPIDKRRLNYIEETSNEMIRVRRGRNNEDILTEYRIYTNVGLVGL